MSHDRRSMYDTVSEWERRVTMVEGLTGAPLPPPPARGYEDLGSDIGKLVAEKNRQYGDSARKSGAIMRILYPNGIPAHAADDALLTVRVLDKLSRISERGPDGKDLGGESPWKDVAGYGLLGWKKDGAE